MKIADAKQGMTVIVVKEIDGTGIKAGMEGRVIYIQNGHGSLERSTNLANQALQVRFKGGAEIWLMLDEVCKKEIE